MYSNLGLSLDWMEHCTKMIFLMVIRFNYNDYRRLNILKDKGTVTWSNLYCCALMVVYLNIIRPIWNFNPTFFFLICSEGEGIHLDKDLDKGYSQNCKTFNNSSLVTEADGHFQCSMIEVLVFEDRVSQENGTHKK